MRAPDTRPVPTDLTTPAPRARRAYVRGVAGSIFLYAAILGVLAGCAGRDAGPRPWPDRAPAAPADGRRTAAPDELLIGFALGLDSPTGDRQGATSEQLAAALMQTGANTVVLPVRWSDVEPAGPGGTPGEGGRSQYDWAPLTANPFLRAARVPIVSIDLASPWADGIAASDPAAWAALAESFARALATQCARLGITHFRVAGEEFDQLARQDWAAAYVARARVVYTAVKAVDPRATVIAGSLRHTTHESLGQLWAAGFADLFDVLEVRAPTAAAVDGIDLDALIEAHAALAAHGAESKKLFLGAGWGMGEPLRADPAEPVASEEIALLRDAVVNGYRRLMTTRPGYSPNWMRGALYSTLNDYTERDGWRDRALPQLDLAGQPTRYLVDGYPRTEAELQPRFLATGLVGFCGEPKGDLLELFPPAFPDHAFRVEGIDPRQPLIVGQPYHLRVALENRSYEPMGRVTVELAAAPGQQETVRIEPVLAPAAESLQPGTRATAEFSVTPQRPEPALRLLPSARAQWRGSPFTLETWYPLNARSPLSARPEPARVVMMWPYQTQSLRVHFENRLGQDHLEGQLELDAGGGADLALRGGESCVVPPGGRQELELQLEPMPGLVPNRHSVLLVGRFRARPSGQEIPVAVPVTIDTAYPIPHSRSPIQIDGSLLDWAGTAKIELGSRTADPQGDPIEATIRFSWDEYALYCAAEVYDRQHAPAAGPATLDAADRLQLRFDPLGNAPVRGEEGALLAEDDLEYLFARLPDAPLAVRTAAPARLETGPTAYLGIAIARDDLAGITSYEIALPWAEFDFVAKSGLLLPAALTIHDIDDSGRGGAFAWPTRHAGAEAQPRFIPLQLLTRE